MIASLYTHICINPSVPSQKNFEFVYDSSSQGPFIYGRKSHIKSYINIRNSKLDIFFLRFLVVLKLHDYLTFVVDANLKMYSLVYKDFLLVSEIKAVIFLKNCARHRAMTNHDKTSLFSLGATLQGH
jgi:hypothetical protein